MTLGNHITLSLSLPIYDTIELKEKKKKFFNKIKSFGADVSSNILVNLWTNPMIYEQLRKML